SASRWLRARKPWEAQSRVTFLLHQAPDLALDEVLGDLGDDLPHDRLGGGGHDAGDVAPDGLVDLRHGVADGALDVIGDQRRDELGERLLYRALDQRREAAADLGGDGGAGELGVGDDRRGRAG